MPQLRDLYLEDCEQVTDVTIQELTKNCGKLSELFLRSRPNYLHCHLELMATKTPYPPFSIHIEHTISSPWTNKDSEVEHDGVPNVILFMLRPFPIFLLQSFVRKVRNLGPQGGIANLCVFFLIFFFPWIYLKRYC